MAAMSAELARAALTHDITAQQPKTFVEFPITRPDNGLPTRFVRRAGGAAAGAPAAARAEGVAAR
jgi:hypothetical protein